MLILRCLCLLFGACLGAQTTLATSYTTNYYLSSHDGGVYFDLVVRNELHLDAIDLNLLSPVGTPGTVEVFVRPGGWSGHVTSTGDWVAAAHGTVASAGAGFPTPCTLSRPVGLPSGHYGIALHLRGVMPLYNFAFGPRSFGNGDLTLTAGGSALRFLNSAPFFYRVFSGALHYTLGGGPYAAATVSPVGAGCQQAARSFYEWFLPGEFDLAQRRFVLTPNAEDGYDVTPIAAAPVVVPAGATNLGLGRQGAAFVQLPVPIPYPGGATSSLRVHSDGRIAFTNEGLLAPFPTQPQPAQLFGGHAMLAAACMDLAPNGADNVYAHVDAATATTTIVWWNVPTFGASQGSGNTFACTVHADGTIELSLAAVANPNEPCLCGFGAGLGARDPGARDLSAPTSFSTAADDPGLGLVAAGRPVLGNTMHLTVHDAPASTIGAAMLFGWHALQPGLDLAAYGAVGCRLYVDPAEAIWVGLAGTREMPCAIPSHTSLLGSGFCAQAAAWTTVGAGVMSNGLALAIGGV